MLAQSEMARQGQSLEFKSDSKRSWNYTTGFFAYALLRLGTEAGDQRDSDFATRVIDSYLGPDGSIRRYDPAEHSLDQIAPGRAVLELYDRTADPRLARAARTLREQLDSQPRTFDGGFWHKGIYPNQIWLDGIYMSGPFYAHYGRVFSDKDALNDATRQILIADQHLFDPRSGLYYHAWDAKHELAWADPINGHSPNFWARSVGWYAMAIVDELDDLPKAEYATKSVEAVLNRVLDGIVCWQDHDTGVWWQVMDQGPRAGNYREASASCMFVYALCKAASRGTPHHKIYEEAARRGFSGIVREFVRRDDAGQLSLTHCCSVAGSKQPKCSRARARRLFRLLCERARGGQRPEGRRRLHPCRDRSAAPPLARPVDSRTISSGCIVLTTALRVPGLLILPTRISAAASTVASIC